MTDDETERVAKVVRGLLEVAKLAMPDSYFASDSRVSAARELLRDIEKARK